MKQSKSQSYFTNFNRQKNQLRIRQKRKNKGRVYYQSFLSNKILYAPANFQILEYPKECIAFFNKLRFDFKNLSYSRNRRQKTISLIFVQKIDFVTLSLLKCIFNELSLNGIFVDGDKPLDKDCKLFLEESGFLTGLYTKTNKKINPKKSKGKMFSFTVNKKKIDFNQLLEFESIAEKAHLIKYGSEGYIDDIACVLKEMGGNCLEWSNSFNIQWQLGLYETENLYHFSVIDLGLGIIETINRRTNLLEKIIKPDYNKILLDSFNGKYGSKERYENRNNGLPLIKRLSEENLLENLSVLSNQAFINLSTSSVHSTNLPTFAGTLYYWCITKKNNETTDLFN